MNNERYKICQGDVLEVLHTLPSESVQVCVTSPPYWNLRDYGVDGQIGLEPTIDAYVQKMVEVFAELRRVLRSDGTLWLNIGDSYAAQRGGTSMPAETLAGGVSGHGDEVAKRGRGDGCCHRRNAAIIGLKHKDLCMVPARVALALQADGWYLRSEIIWAKCAPMPESVTDRPTCAHEKIFLLSKSERYYYDADAVREPAINGDPTSPRSSRGSHTLNEGLIKQDAVGKATYTGFNSRYEPVQNRNLRNVWTLSPESFTGAHFATFPTIIPKRAILAGTSEKGHCPTCGVGWRRVVDVKIGRSKECPKTQSAHEARKGTGVPVGTVGKSGGGRIDAVRREIGWQPGCDCGIEETVPAVVLDPFAGSGTTLAVALSLGRKAIGIELNPEYVCIAEKRIAPYAAQELLPL